MILALRSYSTGDGFSLLILAKIARVSSFSEHNRRRHKLSDSGKNLMNNATPAQAFEALLNYLKHNRGFDFTGYKRASLMRQLKKRMVQLKIESYQEYLDYLKLNSIEHTYLFNTLLINVTTFFRDLSAWQSLAQEIIPRLIALKPDQEAIRIWSAGCASGEEAYTIAIILAEALGTENFKARVRIYATDVDEQALTDGRLANYTSMAVKGVPTEFLDKYFKVLATAYSLHNELRQAVIFGKHNLLQDAPISRLDLLVCRNTLMYFSAENQARILKRFHFALKDTGFLFVGKVELLLNQANLFAPVQFDSCIFSKIPKRRDSLLVAKEAEKMVSRNQLVEPSTLRDKAFEYLPMAQIIVDIYGNLVSANRQARALFGLVSSDFGCLLQDLDIPYLSELQSSIEQAYLDGSSIQLFNLELLTSNDNKIIYLDITIAPLLDCNAKELGVSVVFNDVTSYKLLQRKYQDSTQQLKILNEQLQISNEELRTINEQLKNTNEELSERKNLQ
jgi:two-component system CheB/CheR fusion protein